MDSTMNLLLNKYGLQECVRAFGSKTDEIPREESKIRPDSFIMEYIQTLHLGDGLNRVREGKERALPDNRPAKKRALIIYGEGDSNAWNTSLLGNEDLGKESNSDQTERIDLTKEDNGTTASTDTISQLTQYLDFLQKRL